MSAFSQMPGQSSELTKSTSVHKSYMHVTKRVGFLVGIRRSTSNAIPCGVAPQQFQPV
jgi:hypothetical protein